MHKQARIARLVSHVAWTLVFAAVTVLAWAQPQANAATVIELFGRSGCSRCNSAETYLRALASVRPELTIRHYDVVSDGAALERLRALTIEAGYDQAGVPSVYVRGRLFVGFENAETTGAAIERWLDGLEAAGDAKGSKAGACDPANSSPCPSEPPVRVRLPWFGELDVHALGLPVFTLAMGLIDGFNPCAMWVLMFVLSMLVNLKDRTRMAIIGGTFVLVSGLVYYAFMAAWLNVFLFIGLSRAIQIVLGVLAIAIGAVHVKDFFAFQRGVSLSIPDRAKPGVYRRARDILRAENLAGALAASVVLAVLVNLIELLCTAGLPAIYTQVLAAQHVTPAAHYTYLALYNVAYVLDDSFVLILAVVTLSRRKLQERGGRVLKLLSGSAIIVLGLLLVFEPAWLAW
ncbi:MAG TPA: NrdH-redoxin [Polyangiales bacterium]|nr:NrdH-redoxin [Polyangiales bacterium]